MGFEIINNMELAEKELTIIHTLLYIINALGGQADFHKVFKIQYFADQEHLSKYGSTITDDTYIKMKNGPVLSNAYNMLKDLKSQSSKESLYNSYFDVVGCKAKSKTDADLDELSISEIECLNKAIAKYRDCNFNELTNLSHKFAWKNAVLNRPMSIRDIAIEGGANQDMINYIEDTSENSRLSFA